MKKIKYFVLSFLLLLTFTVSSFAWYHKEGNYLICDYCGASYINAFPRNGHYSWCRLSPSYGQSSVQYVSKAASSSSNNAMEKQMIEAGAQAFGALLTGLFSDNRTPEQIAADNAKKAAEQAAISAENAAKSKEYNILKRDEQYWKSGSFEIKEGKLKFRGGHAYGLYNNATQKWVAPLGADKGEVDGRIAIFRKVKENDDFWIRKSGNIRILEPKDENPVNNARIVWIYYYRQYDKKEDYWNLVKKVHRFYAINENGGLDLLQPFGYPNAFKVPYNGKEGVVKALFDGNVDPSYKYGYYGTETVVPAEFDSIEIFPNDMETLKQYVNCRLMYIAKKNKDTYLFSSTGRRLSPKMTEYDTLTELVGFSEDFFSVSKKGKYGAINSKGQILIPLVYKDAGSMYNSIKDGYNDLSFNSWYRKKAAPYLTTKDKYEKEADYKARLEDPKKQETYIAEKMKNAANDYVNEFKQGASIKLGNYNAETEVFRIEFWVKNGTKNFLSWNSFEMKVPIKEAENFEKNFNSIKDEALKNAKFTIKYDSVAIDKITFTSDGKNYTFKAK